MGDTAKKKSPFLVLSESLHDIDTLFNSKREDLIKSLREGNRAWEERKKRYDPQRGFAENASSGDSTAPNALKRARRGLAKDSDYPSALTIEELLRFAEDTPREKEVKVDTVLK